MTQQIEPMAGGDRSAIIESRSNLAAETQAAIDNGAFDSLVDYRVVPHRHDRAAKLTRYMRAVREQQVRLGLSEPATKQFSFSNTGLLYPIFIATGEAYRFHAAWVADRVSLRGGR